MIITHIITHFFTGVEHATLSYFQLFDGVFAECFTRCLQGMLSLTQMFRRKLSER